MMFKDKKLFLYIYCYVIIFIVAPLNAQKIPSINEQIVHTIEKLESNNLSKDAEKALLMELSKLVLYSNGIETQKKAVDILCKKGLLKHGITSYLFQKFEDYDVESFSQESKEIIIAHLKNEPSELWNHGIYVVEKFGNSTFENQLKSKVEGAFKSTQPLSVNSEEWAALQIFARRGNSNAIDKIITSSEITWGGRIDGKVRIMYLISYMRQKEAIDIFYKYLLSEERLAPIEKSVQLGMEPVIFTNRFLATEAIWYLADLLDGFPLQQKENRLYSTEDIELAREWMKAQNGNWIILGQHCKEQTNVQTNVKANKTLQFEAEIVRSKSDQPTQTKAEEKSKNKVAIEQKWLWLSALFIIILAGIFVIFKRKKQRQ